jgi:hypothetical protein
VDVRHWVDQLRPVFAGRRVIVTSQVLAAATSVVQALHRLGADDVLVVASGGPGTGELPDAECLSLEVDVSGLSLHQSIQRSHEAFADLPAWLVERLDGFDPEHRALALGDFLNELIELAGRPFLAYRRPDWVRLDDKTVVDAFWDRAGVARAPSRVVPAEREAVLAVADELDRGGGVVVAVDSSKGWTGGGAGVRRIRRDGDAEPALSEWTGQRVRVMPFLEGIPCSIHGIVVAGTVVALRPVEMVVLRRDGGEFLYCGCSSFWDPPPEGREQMREVARRAGAALRDEVRYRGAFTVDGVMTDEGFLPTELNPRNGAGLVMMARTLDDELPLQLLLDALVGEVEADWRPAQLESLLVEHFDAHRAGGTWRGVPVAIEPGELDLDGGHLSVGPSPIGTFLRLTLEGAVGESVGPRATAFWSWADERWGLGLGPLSCAAERRPTR